MSVTFSDTSMSSSGSATSAKQDTGNTSLASIDSKLTSPLSVSISGSSTTLTPTSGKVTLSGSALAFGSGQKDKILIIAGDTNLNSLYVGASGVSSSNGAEFIAGRDAILENVDLATLFVNGTAGYLTWLALS